MSIEGITCKPILRVSNKPKCTPRAIDRKPIFRNRGWIMELGYRDAAGKYQALAYGYTLEELAALYPAVIMLYFSNHKRYWQ